jgi:hypothetical protein
MGFGATKAEADSVIVLRANVVYYANTPTSVTAARRAAISRCLR